MNTNGGALGIAVAGLLFVGCGTKSAGGEGTDSDGAVCELPEWFSCPAADLCTAVGCGAIGRLDADGCERSSCEGPADCAAGEICFESTRARMGFSSAIWCDVQEETCQCGGTLDGRSLALCTDEASVAAADCKVQGLTCDELLAFSGELADAFVQRLSWNHMELAESLGTCAVTLETAILDMACTTPCAALCRLHPCSGYEASCESACETAAAQLSPEQLEAVVLGAAQAPGLCTCDPCDADTFSLCASVWDCQGG